MMVSDGIGVGGWCCCWYWVLCLVKGIGKFTHSFFCSLVCVLYLNHLHAISQSGG
jgi:hypothetical protein